MNIQVGCYICCIIILYPLIVDCTDCLTDLDKAAKEAQNLARDIQKQLAASEHMRVQERQEFVRKLNEAAKKDQEEINRLKSRNREVCYCCVQYYVRTHFHIS